MTASTDVLDGILDGSLAPQDETAQQLGQGKSPLIGGVGVSDLDGKSLISPTQIFDSPPHEPLPPQPLTRDEATAAVFALAQAMYGDRMYAWVKANPGVPYPLEWRGTKLHWVSRLERKARERDKSKLVLP